MKDFVLIVSCISTFFAIMMLARFLMYYDVRVEKKRQARTKLLSILESLPIEEIIRITRRKEMGVLTTDEDGGSPVLRLPAWITSGSSDEELLGFGTLIGSIIHHYAGRPAFVWDLDRGFLLREMTDKILFSLTSARRELIYEGCGKRHPDARTKLVEMVDEEIESGLEEKRGKEEEEEERKKKREIQAGLKACKRWW
ncbi:MAG: hypothetical protein UV64_C0009G0007 [Parcubacteria group bacterium GW2011_GWC1_43_11b]|nr:MAG: hypothetical protein UV50_C0008G0002 [Parcubacteria group bacterium GW2011_GWB1_42_9]KKS89204.1 MAG: hypothetical protein UV64_C0009G0007 [Parcubacteria group bacterium GW2011_GWC1_43_11b]KKT09299.1 MAG: hypothetical protein UV88_C0012G0006 [Parcubacteria group bacterium GW2011_GWA1_43_21]